MSSELNGSWLGGRMDREEALVEACEDVIETQTAMEFVRRAYALAPDNFWVQPSSTSGRWHPADEFVEGGKALHTLRAITLGAEMLRAFPGWAVEDTFLDLDTEEAVPTSDIFMVALAIHDLCANGMPDNVFMKDGRVATDPDHPLYVRRLLRGSGDWRMQSMLDNLWTDKVFELVEAHSGIWSPEGYSPFERQIDGGMSAMEFLAPMVHWVDYVVSRNFVKIDVEVQS